MSEYNPNVLLANMSILFQDFRKSCWTLCWSEKNILHLVHKKILVSVKPATWTTWTRSGKHPLPVEHTIISVRLSHFIRPPFTLNTTLRTFRMISYLTLTIAIAMTNHKLHSWLKSWTRTFMIKRNSMIKLLFGLRNRRKKSISEFQNTSLRKLGNILDPVCCLEVNGNVLHWLGHLWK